MTNPDPQPNLCDTGHMLQAKAAMACAALNGRTRVNEGDLRTAVQLMIMPRATAAAVCPPPFLAPPPPPPPAPAPDEEEEEEEDTEVCCWHECSQNASRPARDRVDLPGASILSW